MTTGRPRANVYVDGFNLYHGCFDDLKHRPHWRTYRWLDLDTLCRRMFPHYLINRIRYFTALVDPLPNNPYNRDRQLLYIRALQTIPHLSVHQGRFATNVKDRPIADLTAPRPTPRLPMQMVPVIEREEKGSDVNLASHLLMDGFHQEYEVAIVVTNDSDLAEPIRMVRNTLRLNVGIVNPRKYIAYDLRGIATFNKNIRLHMLQASEFPETLNDAHGIVMKPARWN